ncbi:MAG: YbaB/EbfC family nucleoid-associated protein [Halanaerobiales bacterium]|nr:YbaB/EbfC family nucleoid-associated protein [Halanaerobiales bacterium]
MENMNMNSILGKIEMIKRQLKNLQEELAETTVKGNDDGEIVTAIVSGTGKLLDYQLNFEAFGTINQEDLRRALIQATNNGLQQAKQLEITRKKEIVGEVNLPDIPGLF